MRNGRRKVRFERHPAGASLRDAVKDVPPAVAGTAGALDREATS
jgi:hypothetical protein